MLKRFFLILALAAGLLSPAYGAGSIPLSLTTQFDSLGHLLVGGKVYFYQAGTVATPQNAYQDSALTLPWANPITLDASARVPQLFFADGSIKVRITDANGVQIFTQDGILVIGASSGGGGGSPVDATTVLATGDLKVKYGTGALTGFVRANGRTIGSATSGASERANSDCQTLFEYLWAADANLSVSTGRGASANADWVANKTIALPDWRGRALAGLDDMGNSAASRLTATYFGTSGIVLGAAGGTESKTLLTANLPAYTPAGTIADHNHAIHVNPASQVNGTSPSTTVPTAGNTSSSFATLIGTTDNASTPFVGTAQGGLSTPVAVASPMMLATIYLKL